MEAVDPATFLSGFRRRWCILDRRVSIQSGTSGPHAFSWMGLDFLSRGPAKVVNGPTVDPTAQEIFNLLG